MQNYTLDWKRYSELARQTAAEGCVLLRNENGALPLASGETVAVFGRIQLDYYRSGTGSGGMVNVPYSHSVLDGLMAYANKGIAVYEPLLAVYRAWVEDHPFDKGVGWGAEPWSQEEMPLTQELVDDAAQHCGTAVVIIGRTAGEDRDNTPQGGSYYLTDVELAMLKDVCAAFSRTVVVLNTGNIIEMGWMETCHPDAVLLAWQGGMEGGLGTADVLCGAVSPSGKLSDTIARELDDYPSMRNFGSDTRNLYQEDIYVGYRYFETFAKDKVLFPFGFGLSYTDFVLKAQLQVPAVLDAQAKVTVTAEVNNTGDCAGKEVVQVYCCPPQGTLGKPLRSLCGFVKTKTLAPGESETVTLSVPLAELASFDDGGVTGHPNCFVLEKGTYQIYVGTDVRSASPAGSFALGELLEISRHEEALAPVTPFTRFRPVEDTNDARQMRLEEEDVPLRTVNPAERRRSRLPECLPYTGDSGYQLRDVAAGTVGLEEFLAQISDEDLCDLVKGEGMCSPKVTPGTASAFGGITDTLAAFGIPAGCCADGPSGIRMDCGTSAFGLPNGTLLACTFNVPLVTELFGMEGLELYANKIDSLLGPGINIHRNPLNGRNFEYHSEDPYLTGCMAKAQLAGMDRYGVSGTIKHFCCNNQEHARFAAESVVSARALREIYLKPFEMSVKDGHTRSVMTTYAGVNGIWTAGNYDLDTTILREDWGHKGIVMTDWWAKMNDEGEPASNENLAAMVRAQNDVYMVTPDAHTYKDNLKDALADGSLTRAELVRSAANICSFLLASPAMQRVLGTYQNVEHVHMPDALALSDGEDVVYIPVGEDTTIPLDERTTEAGTSFILAVTFEKMGVYRLSLDASSEGSELAQMSVTLTLDNTILCTCTYHGHSEHTLTVQESVIFGTTHFIKFFFAQSGISLHSFRAEYLHELDIR